MHTGAIQNWANMLFGRMQHAATYFSEKVYVFGGYKSKILKKSEQLDLSKNKWSPLPDLPQPTANNNAVVLKGIIYITGFYLSSVLKYDPFSSIYTKFSIPRGNVNKVNKGILALNETLLVFV